MATTKDPYETLGVSKNATDAEIKKALVSGFLKRRLIAQTEQNFGGLESFCEFERNPIVLTLSFKLVIITRNSLSCCVCFRANTTNAD